MGEDIDKLLQEVWDSSYECPSIGVDEDGVIFCYSLGEKEQGE